MAVGDLGKFASPILSVGALHQSSGAASGFALDSAFVKATSGDAILIRYTCLTADTIDALWVFVHAVTGLVTAMACDIYNESAAFSPGTTLRDSSTAVAIPTTTKWAKFTFGSPYTPTVGEILWFIVYNTTATPASNYPSIRTAATAALGSSSDQYFRLKTFTSINGGVSQISTYEMPCMVQQGSRYFANPITVFNNTLIASDTNEKGIQFTVPTGLVFTLYGYETTASTSNLDTAKLYADATAPAGSVLASWDLDSDANELTVETQGCKIFDTPYACAAGDYKFVFDPGGAVSLGGMGIEDYATYSTEFDTLFDNWAAPKAVVENAGAWTVDGRGIAGIRLLIGVTAAASGGLLTHPGYSGRV